MLLRICATILVLGLPLLSASNPNWTLMRSENFDLLTDGNEKMGRRVLNHFEQVRSFFRQTMRQTLAPQRVTIVQFNDEGNYRQFRVSRDAAAFYVYGTGMNMVVMGPRTSSNMTVAVHEYVHVLLRHSGLSIPLWLNEGIAEVYSTLTPVSGKMQVGTPPEGRAITLSSGAQMPLKTLFSADHTTPGFSNYHNILQFYARSWALAHMLMLENGLRERFDALLKSLSEGASSEAAVWNIYGLTVDQLEDKLVQYLKMPTINVARFPVQVAAKSEATPPRPAEPYEYEVALAFLEAAQDKYSSAIQRCERLKASFPSRPEPNEALAYLHLRQSQSEPVVALLAEALANASASREAPLQFLRMAPSGHPMLARAEGAASRWLERNAADMELRLVLARRQLAGQRFAQARATLSAVKNVGRSDAAEYFALMAQAAIGENDPGEAAIAVGRLKQYLPADRQAEADRLQSAVDALTAMAARASSAAPTRDRVHTAFASQRSPDSPAALRQSATPSGYQPEPDSGPPVIRYVEPKPDPKLSAKPQSKWRTPDSLPSVEGHFASLECSGARAAMLITTANRTLRLFIDDPLSIEMKNGSGASMEFSCGKQTDLRRVVIQYEPMPAGRAGDGLVRSILFQ